MTNAPADLLGLRASLQSLTGLSAVDIGIVGDEAHAQTGGYHIGKTGLVNAGVWSTDYSVRLTRDRDGATESASAMDVGQAWRQGRATWIAWNNLLVSALHANDPALSAVRAVNYTPDGTVKRRTDRESGWSVVSSSDTVDIHTHIEWYRNTEGVRQSSLDRIAALASQAITGEVDDMSTVDGMRLKLLYENWAPTRSEWLAAGGDPARYDSLGADGSGLNGVSVALASLASKVDTLVARPPVTVDAAAVASQLAADTSFIAALAAAVVTQVRGAVDDVVETRLDGATAVLSTAGPHST